MTDKITFIMPPTPVGWWVLPGRVGGTCVKFAAFKKPRWLTRKLMHWVFQWEYET